MFALCAAYLAPTIPRYALHPPEEPHSTRFSVGAILVIALCEAQNPATIPRIFSRDQEHRSAHAVENTSQTVFSRHSPRTSRLLGGLELVRQDAQSRGHAFQQVRFDAACSNFQRAFDGLRVR
jgi:hypothetical protein